MESSGRLVSVARDIVSGKLMVSFIIDTEPVDDLNNLAKLEKIDIKAEKYREKRSNLANKLLWGCLSDIAKAMTPPEDVWDVYLRMLKRYGEFTYITVKPELVEATKRVWRETQVVGEIEVDGEKRVEMLCFFGSSTLDTKEFSVLLDGVISEMEQMGLKIPLSKDKQKALGL